jgi:hypothetical protein
MADAAAVPVWLSGAWERLYVRDDGGPPDRSVNVRNIQTPTLFGDCRIPKDRPRYPKAHSLRDLSDAELATLYPQEGFSGFTTVEGYVTTWHHEIDYQPPDGSVDIGRIELAGGRNMYEHGVQASYLEHWWYLESGGEDFFGVKVLRRRPEGTTRVHEILSVAGDHFIYARNRPVDLPMAPSLAELIESTDAGRDKVLEYLDCEVSHGFVLGGRRPWEIQFSTFPFREGEPLDFARQIVVDPRTGTVSHRGETPDEIWSFPVNTLDLEDLVVLFPEP